MRYQRTHQGTILLSIIFIISIIITSCATMTPVVPGDLGELEPASQSPVDVPGGLMILPDAVGTEHPVLVFDFQIQSRLVTYGEYGECVEEGVCEPAVEAIHDYAPAGVSWYQAQTYCSYLGGRLPTEAELTRATGGNEDCSDTGVGQIGQEGFGEWVYDWDDPEYYNGSLVSNPFGPLFGDLKVAMGLDLDALNEVMYKYFGKYEDAESFAKYDEYKSADKVEDTESFAKIEDTIFFDKIDELKVTFAKYDGQYVVKFEDGKFFVKVESVGMDKSSPDQASIFPRMGMLPELSNPLVGFRCVTQGAALTYAPICKTQTATNCSLPTDKMQTISAQLDGVSSVDPNFEIAGANCPQNGMFDLTISHELPSGEGVLIKTGGEECTCQEYEDYPGNLYCSCPSPGAGVKTEIVACASGEDNLISMDDFCQPGSYYSLETGGCARAMSGTPLIYSLVKEGEPSSCPGGPGLPVPNYGPLGMAVISVEGIGEDDLPKGDQWEIFSLSDGSGMCPPGYAFNLETGCCSPYSGDNYDCGPDEYFDAGLKQCLPVGWDGCGPCQELGSDGECGYSAESKFISPRCNSGNDEDNEVEFDEYGRGIESSEGCDAGAYKDPNLGLCLETQDGCALGTYLDPKRGTCRPINGPESPCPEGYSYNTQTGCCVPSPGTGESECPEGTEWDGAGCTRTVSGCPPTHYYDEETDSCLLREPGECPGGTSLSLIGKCIPDETGVCPEDYAYDPETDSCYSSKAGEMVCDGGKLFDPALGICWERPASGTGHEGGGGGRCDLEDLSTTEYVDRETPDLDLHCFDPESALLPIRSTVESPDGVFECLILSANKTFNSGWGFCRPQASGDDETEQYFTVEIEEGRLAKITRVEPDQIDPASAEPPETEGFECGLQYVFGRAIDVDVDTGDDDWSATPTPTSGTLPGGAKCQIGLYVDAGALFNLQNCTTKELYVPTCLTGPTPGPPDICAGLDFGTCGNTGGCAWSINQKKCVVDNCTGVASEEKCDAISGCIWQGGICMVD